MALFHKLKVCEVAANYETSHTTGGGMDKRIPFLRIKEYMCGEIVANWLRPGNDENSKPKVLKVFHSKTTKSKPLEQDGEGGQFGKEKCPHT